MNILVTGGTGFIGAQLVTKLLVDGHNVFVATRDPEAAKARFSEQVSFFEWSSHEDLPKIATDTEVDCVVHLAGETVTGRWNEKKRAKIRDTRVIGTKNLLSALEALQTPPKIFISASAIGFYGDRGDEELTEHSEGGADFLADVCTGWEQSTRENSGFIEYVSMLRIGIVLGQGGGALASMLTPFKMGVGGPMGNGRQWWSWIHIEDLINLIRFLIENPQNGPVNATSPGSMRQRDFAKVLAKTLKRPSFFPTPGFMLKMTLGGFSSELLSSKRVSPERAHELGFTFDWPSLDGALNQLIHNQGNETA